MHQYARGEAPFNSALLEIKQKTKYHITPTNTKRAQVTNASIIVYRSQRVSSSAHASAHPSNYCYTLICFLAMKSDIIGEDQWKKNRIRRRMRICIATGGELSIILGAASVAKVAASNFRESPREKSLSARAAITHRGSSRSVLIREHRSAA